MEIRDYTKSNSKQKWYSVTVFEHCPRESPKTSKEGEEIAKFTGKGDAFHYAYCLKDRPLYQDCWAIVIK